MFSIGLYTFHIIAYWVFGFNAYFIFCIVKMIVIKTISCYYLNKQIKNIEQKKRQIKEENENGKKGENEDGI